jgi:ankyrin repeat protein
MSVVKVRIVFPLKALPASLLIGLLCSGCHAYASHGYRDDPKLTPLMNAARHNDLPQVRTLLSNGVDVKARTAQGETALYEAIERIDLRADNLPIVDALLQAGADPNEREAYDLDALSVSLTRDYANPAVTLRLLQAGAHVSRDCPPGNSEDSLLSLATMDSSTKVMRALIAKGSPVNCQFRGAPALYWAALNGQCGRVELLLQSGADPRQQDDKGRAILETATTTNPDSRVRADFAKTRQLIQEALKSTKPKTP